MADRPDELLSAYVDGVSELTSAERKLVEDHLASEPGRADELATRQLLGRLRELPPLGQEPDWSALERSIGDAVGPAVARSWWQRLGWRLAVPCAAFATIVALVLVVPHDDEGATPVAGIAPAPVADVAHEPALADEATVQLWLDGATVEVGLNAEELLPEPWGGDLYEEDLLPAADLAWIDELDADALERAEDYLDRKRT